MKNLTKTTCQSLEGQIVLLDYSKKDLKAIRVSHKLVMIPLGRGP